MAAVSRDSHLNYAPRVPEMLLFYMPSPAASSLHETPVSLLLMVPIREAGYDLTISPIAERATNVIAQRDRLSFFYLI